MGIEEREKEELAEVLDELSLFLAQLEGSRLLILNEVWKAKETLEKGRKVLEGVTC